MSNIHKKNGLKITLLLLLLSLSLLTFYYYYRYYVTIIKIDVLCFNDNKEIWD